MRTTTRSTLAVGCALLLGLSGVRLANAVPVLGADFSAAYTATSLGSVTGLPTNYGGLTFLNSGTLLIGGAANTDPGRLYTVDVLRDGAGHITGFGSSASLYSSVGAYNDGGVTFGPGGVLFTSRWPVNQLGQTKPGSTIEDKVIDLAPFGVADSNAALGFVPFGFGGAGQFKLVSWSGGEFYTATLTPDGSGTFDIASIVQEDLDPFMPGIQSLAGGPEGFVYIDGANVGFAGLDSMLVSDYSANRVSAYELDGNGNPLVATRRDFLTGLVGAEGAVIDPLTGDFLFSTFGGDNEILVVQGFAVPPPPPCGVPGKPDCGGGPVPEPGSLPLVALALWGLVAVARRAQGRG